MGSPKKFKVNNVVALERIRNLDLFENTSQTMSGRGGAVYGMGYLPSSYEREAMSATYVVYSYRTIIAYVTKDGRKVVPDVGFSGATSGHQDIVKRAWGITQFAARGREVVKAGGGPRRGGWDDHR
jgi:hypothetical protein